MKRFGKRVMARGKTMGGVNKINCGAVIRDLAVALIKRYSKTNTNTIATIIVEFVGSYI
jgi:hypothetical protein